MITLTRKDNQDSITLPDRFRWLDEHDWSPLAQSAPDYSLGGAIIIQQGTRLAGRPVTLGNDAEHDWLRKSVVAQLLAWAAVPELEMTLDYQGKQLSVIWRNHEQALQASPVLWQHDEGDDAWYHVELRLMTI